MRVVILNQFFYPDHSAASQLMTDLAESLVESGVEVTALAARGRYNGGGRLPAKGEHKGVRIERAWATGFGKRTRFGRLADYLSFYVSASWKLLRVPRPDIVLALTMPPLIGFAALVVCRLRGIRLVALVHDLYPDIAVALGVIKKDALLTQLLDRLARFTLRHADRVIVLGDCMRARVFEKLGEKSGEKISEKAGDTGSEMIGKTGVSRLDVISNWADGEMIQPLGKSDNPFVNEHRLEDKFVVQLSGNLGQVNDFQTVLEAALLLRDRKDIVFLFIGDGGRRGEIELFAAAHQLDNIRLLPYQPRESLRYSLAVGDAHLVTLAAGLAGLCVPSKTYGILAAGRPILYVGDAKSDIARLVKEHRCGALADGGDSEKVAHIIREWAADKARLAEMGSRARALFEGRFDRRRAVAEYLESFARCLNPEARRAEAATAANAPAAEALRAER